MTRRNECNRKLRSSAFAQSFTDSRGNPDDRRRGSTHLPLAFRFSWAHRNRYRDQSNCTVKFPSEADTLFDALRKSAKAKPVSAIEKLIQDGPDRDLCRINALAFAAQHKLNEEDVIAAFLHAAALGIFDMSWNILCPACGGVLDSGATLKTVKQAEYRCVLCAIGHEPTLDEIVEVTFTISPRVRRIAAHDPDTLSWIEYYRQVFWSSVVDFPDDETFAKWLKETTLGTLELSPGEKVVLGLELPEGFVDVYDSVVNMSLFMEIKGEPAGEGQSLCFIM